MKRPPTASPENRGFSLTPSPNTIANKVSAAMMSAPVLCTTLPLRRRMRSSPITSAMPTETSSAVSASVFDLV